MRRPTYLAPSQTEANRTSQTRFGPRPVPTGDRVTTARPRAGADDTSASAKVIVWAGVALGMAGVTAAAAIAARRLAGHDDDDDLRHARRDYRHGAVVAPSYAQLDEEEREAMRRRVRAQSRSEYRARDAEGPSSRLRGRPAKPARRQGNFAKDLTRTATDLSEGLNGVAHSLAGAFQAFRGVSSQATTIVGDFVAAADQLRAILNGAPGPRPGAPSERMSAPRRDDTPV